MSLIRNVAITLGVFASAGAGLQAQTAGADKKPASPMIGVDRNGDALPDGAIGRLGTTRFRHGFNATGVVYAPNGKVLASAGRLPGVSLFDAGTGRLLRRHEETVFVCPAFSRDGKSLFTGQKIIDVATGKVVRKFLAPGANPGASAAFSPDGSTVASGGFGNADTPIVLWDAATGKERRRLKGHDGEIDALAFHPHDSTILASASYDKTVRIWNIATGKQIHRLDGHEKPVLRVAFSPNGKLLASAGEDSFIRIWDADSGKALRLLKLDKYGANSIAFSADGKSLASSAELSGVIHLWNPETGNEIRHWEASAFVNGVAFSPDGKTLASAAGSAIRLWNPDTGKEINPVTSHQGMLLALRYAADGKTLFSTGRDRRMIQWDLASHRPRDRFFAGPFRGEAVYWRTIDISADGKLLAQTSLLFNPGMPTTVPPDIHLWNTSTGEKIHSLQGHKGYVASLKFSPDGKLLASGGDDGVHVWSVASKERKFHFKEDTRVIALAFALDGGGLVSAALDGTIRSLDVVAGKELKRWNAGHDVSTLTVSADGGLIAAGGDAEVSIWAADSGNKVAQLAVPSLGLALGFSPTGRVLASSGPGLSDVQLWEVASGQLLRKLETQQALVSCLAFAPDGRTLATGGGDATILLFDLTGQAGAKPKPPTAQQLDEWWSHLRGDAAKADPAIWRMALAPAQSIPFLQERLKPAPPADEKQLAKWLTGLNSKMLGDRQQAEQALIALGESAEPGLRSALKQGLPLETCRRIEQILAKRDPDALRLVRTIDALEQIGTTEARRLLREVLGASRNPRVIRAAEAACRRLERSESCIGARLPCSVARRTPE